MISKPLARKQLRDQLRSRSDQMQACSQQLIPRLENFLSRCSLRVLGAFSPMPDEPQLTKFFTQKHSFALAFPWMNGDQMVYRIGHFAELEQIPWKGKTFPMLPKESQEVVPSVLLIPGLAFDADGYRLGRGGGYFDRFLQSYQGLRLGMALEFQTNQEFPRDPHDERVHCAITDQNLHFYSSELRESWMQGNGLNFPQVPKLEVQNKLTKGSST